MCQARDNCSVHFVVVLDKSFVDANAYTNLGETRLSDVLQSRSMALKGLKTSTAYIAQPAVSPTMRFNKM